MEFRCKIKIYFTLDDDHRKLYFHEWCSHEWKYNFLWSLDEINFDLTPNLTNILSLLSVKQTEITSNCRLISFNYKTANYSPRFVYILIFPFKLNIDKNYDWSFYYIFLIGCSIFLHGCGNYFAPIIIRSLFVVLASIMGH